MKSLTLRTNIVPPEKMCRAPFLFAPLALIVCAGAQAAVPGAGALGNQLRQESVRTPPAPAGAPLVLPE
ncbi:ShlB/FhaC/HecB family hemolysin secretion/activation protein, partial [Salmonella enterica]|nr:ShlB/FhaC/HecB family hemolysin secretion/activation protein [Salmonella enterica]EKC7672600.1 ShlB/FhaC/HecB family hemolysin secretion/activation protein [Salmonella enterica]